MIEYIYDTATTTIHTPHLVVGPCASRWQKWTTFLVAVGPLVQVANGQDQHGHC